MSSDVAGLTAVLHGGSRHMLEDELDSLLAIGTPEVTIMEGAWPTLYGNADRGPDLSFWRSTRSS